MKEGEREKGKFIHPCCFRGRWKAASWVAKASVEVTKHSMISIGSPSQKVKGVVLWGRKVHASTIRCFRELNGKQNTHACGVFGQCRGDT